MKAKEIRGHKQATATYNFNTIHKSDIDSAGCISVWWFQHSSSLIPEEQNDNARVLYERPACRINEKKM